MIGLLATRINPIVAIVHYQKSRALAKLYHEPPRVCAAALGRKKPIQLIETHLTVRAEPFEKSVEALQVPRETFPGF